MPTIASLVSVAAGDPRAQPAKAGPAGFEALLGRLGGEVDRALAPGDEPGCAEIGCAEIGCAGTGCAGTGEDAPASAVDPLATPVAALLAAPTPQAPVAPDAAAPAPSAPAPSLSAPLVHAPAAGVFAAAASAVADRAFEVGGSGPGDRPRPDAPETMAGPSAAALPTGLPVAGPAPHRAALVDAVVPEGLAARAAWQPGTDGGAHAPRALEALSREATGVRTAAEAGRPPVPLLVDAGQAVRAPARDPAQPRTGRLPTVAERISLPGESVSGARFAPGSSPPTGVAPLADIRFAPRSGPERMDSEPAQARLVSGFEMDADIRDIADPAPSGHVQSARLSIGPAERLSITLAAATEASRDLLERERGDLVADLAAVGAKVEAIRVDLAARVNPDGRADAAGGQHPGPGQGGGAPWDRGGQPEQAAARGPEVPAAARSSRPEGRVAADGGKVDRYA